MADSSTYPTREPFFAVRFCRMLDKSVVAHAIGMNAVALLKVIVMQEDAKRYRGPVTFHNSPLLNMVGLTKWKQLDSARKKAVDGGFLHYTCQGNHQPGIYWVLAPEGDEQVSDTPADDGIPTWKQGYKTGFVDGNNALANRHGLIADILILDTSLAYEKEMKGRQEGIRKGDEVEMKGRQHGIPFLPSPSPSPDPKEIQPPLSPTGEIGGFVSVEQVSFPEGMGTPQAVAALEEWIAYKRKRRQAYKDVGYVQRLLDGFAAEHGVDASRVFADAVNHSISQNWAGCFPPRKKTDPSQRPKAVDGI